LGRITGTISSPSVPTSPEKHGVSIEAVDVGKEGQEENQPKIAKASTVKA